MTGAADCPGKTLAEAGGASPPVAARRVPWSKRALDLALALPLLVLLSPVLLAGMLLVRLSGPGPILFRQERIGLGGRPFAMLKLRTMQVGNDDSAFRAFNRKELMGELEPGQDGLFRLGRDPRITPVGHLLRRFSIDELPQLLNVLKGEMSLVGPRPSLPWEAELYTPEQRRRESVLPGMTGLWQVSGRNRLSIPEMLALDVRYARERSLLLDLWILLRTPRAVLFERNTG
jgi:lipopolysaccharide/colanic/teichoic acid biosynthesis glycosyltransferase